MWLFLPVAEPAHCSILAPRIPTTIAAILDHVSSAWIVNPPVDCGSPNPFRIQSPTPYSIFVDTLDHHCGMQEQGSGSSITWESADWRALYCIHLHSAFAENMSRSSNAGWPDNSSHEHGRNTPMVYAPPKIRPICDSRCTMLSRRQPTSNPQAAWGPSHDLLDAAHY